MNTTETEQNNTTALWAGEYRGQEYWAFPGLRGFWNGTARQPVKCLPNRSNPFDIEDLTEVEAAALKARGLALP